MTLSWGPVTAAESENVIKLQLRIVLLVFKRFVLLVKTKKKNAYRKSNISATLCNFLTLK